MGGMERKDGLEEDWKVLVSFLPEDWERLAIRTDALKGLRRDKVSGKMPANAFDSFGLRLFIERDSPASAGSAAGKSFGRGCAQTASQERTMVV